MVFKTANVIPTKFHPDIKVSVFALTENRREDLRNKMSEPLTKLAAIAQKLEALNHRTDEASSASRTELMAQLSKIQRSDIFDLKLRWGLKKIEGLEIGDDDESVPGTVDNWGEWPSELAEEVVFIIDQAAGLLPPE